MTGWTDFWDHRGTIGVAGIIFLINLATMLLISLSGAPLFSMMSPSFGLAPVPPPNLLAGGYHSLFILGIAGVVTALAIAPFIMAATPASLIDAVSDQFSIAGYFQKGARYFWRALGLLWLGAAVFIVVMLLSGLIISLLSLLFGLIFGKTAGISGTILGFSILILPWITIFSIYTITMLHFLTSKERGLGASISGAISLVKERFWSTMGILALFVALSLVGVIIMEILKYIPVIGIIVAMFVSSAISVIGYMAIMAFTGLIPGKR